MIEVRDGQVWLILYEDPDRDTEIFIGYGARHAARDRYDEISTSWNATLFMSVESNYNDREVGKPTDAPPEPSHA